MVRVLQHSQFSKAFDTHCLWTLIFGRVCVFDGCTDTLHRRALMMPESMIIHVSNRCFVFRGVFESVNSVVLSKQRKIIQFDG